MSRAHTTHSLARRMTSPRTCSLLVGMAMIGAASWPAVPSMASVSSTGKLGYSVSASFTFNGGLTQSLVADGQGGVWVSDATYGSVVRITGIDAPTPTVESPIAVNGGSGQLGSMTIDGAGDLWVSDASNGTVYRIADLTSSSPVVSGPFSVGGSPWLLATDPSGNVWVANYDDGTVQEITDASTASPMVKEPITVGSNAAAPAQMTFDGAGDLWVALSGVGQVARVATPSTAPVVTTYDVGSGSSSTPWAIIALPTGKIWVSLCGDGAVQEISRVSSATPKLWTPGGSLSDPVAFAWAHHRLYVKDDGTFSNDTSTGPSSISVVRNAINAPRPVAIVAKVRANGIDGSVYQVKDMISDQNGNLWTASYSSATVQRVTVRP